ncbi:replicase [Turkey associated porprismacovirus 1]|uniref:Replicase n=1 Tax=Turkey associated porprismacovirus 1 TaxID=2170130 RepID=W0GAI5_9VIRU|nr:replicase [Turkey associated porprismacovirus 1]AHF54685.1 replicase [Turkey associated porprismacovirus 1]
MKKYIMTVPRSVPKKALKIMIDVNDCKKWIIGKERGKNGYEHWQIRIETSNDEFFKWCKHHIPAAHIEEAQQGVDECLYERKEGQFWTSSDRVETLHQRFGTLRPRQERALLALQSTNDREVMVWYDANGNVGKSWFCGALWERGLAYVTPPTVDTVKGLIQWVASCYMDGGWRPYVIIDIPRSWKWSDQLYCAIESIKDGLIYDTRYHARMINIRGVKVLVLTNTLPKLDKLSRDRWCIFEF